MSGALDPKKIKSAQRVLEVLEYFNRDRRECTVMDIARTYGYPQSSTSELLSCLVALGYLRRDIWARTYKPAARVAMIGAWIQPHLFRNGALFSLIDEVVEDTGCSVMVSSRVGVSAQVFHISGPEGVDTEYAVGEQLSLLHSAPGQLLVSTERSAELRKLVHRLNAETDEEHQVRPSEYQELIEQVVSEGWSSVLDEGHGVELVSVLLPLTAEDETLVVSVCLDAAVADERRDDVVQTIRGAIARNLDPERAAARDDIHYLHRVS
ncbi:IclR family transcriptional regulator [Parvularcula marina]|uniref:IclR family transcriptional regulator n=1 Tax=Parvularcula marina TaxID=2292771 RepID=A0A371RLC4_9PROT|nr:helix-turn-helix domain-containing protein [Parvularcula marina]RFB06265.1 IclR family transcriptional regulator [Parvularcula marina]